MTIEAYLDSIKERFVTDPFVTSFHVIPERSTLIDGHLRVRLTLADGSQLEFGGVRAPVSDTSGGSKGGTSQFSVPLLYRGGGLVDLCPKPFDLGSLG
jgi:hypothetical protein